MKKIFSLLLLLVVAMLFSISADAMFESCLPKKKNFSFPKPKVERGITETYDDIMGFGESKYRIVFEDQYSEYENCRRNKYYNKSKANKVYDDYGAFTNVKDRKNEQNDEPTESLLLFDGCYELSVTAQD